MEIVNLLKFEISLKALKFYCSLKNIEIESLQVEFYYKLNEIIKLLKKLRNNYNNPKKLHNELKLEIKSFIESLLRQPALHSKSLKLKLRILRTEINSFLFLSFLSLSKKDKKFKKYCSKVSMSRYFEKSLLSLNRRELKKIDKQFFIKRITAITISIIDNTKPDYIKY